MNCKEKFKKLIRKISTVMKFLQNIIWPIINGEPEDPEKVSIDHFKKRLEEAVELSTIREMYELAKGSADKEGERYQNITSKVFTLLGATGIVSAIILSFSKFLLVDIVDFPIYIHIIIFSVYVFCLIYFLMSILFSLKVIYVEKFYTLGPTDISENKNQNEEVYLKSILYKLFVFTEKNYCITNRKINFFILATAFFLRGIVTLVSLGVIIAICTILF